MATKLPSLATDTLLDRARRSAKQQVKVGATTHAQALEEAAAQAGYPAWRDLVEANRRRKAIREANKSTAAAADHQALPLDPELPAGFDDRANEDRSKEELDRWWDSPFALTRNDGTFEVRCLDGGAWDRSVWYGHAATLDEARALARTKLAAWKTVRDRPLMVLDDDSGLVDLMTFGGRPDKERFVAHGLTREQAKAWIAAWEASAGAD